MRTLSSLFLITILVVVIGACSQNQRDNLVFVNGGTFINTTSNLYKKGATIAPFFIGKYEVTQKEWVEVMGSNPSKFKGDNLPVEMVSWYDCVEYCNNRSSKAGLTPYYTVDKNKKDENIKTDLDDIKWTVTINPGANGYRLPTEVEWEYASGGGEMSESFLYSGSNDVNQVAWYWRNSGDTILAGEWFFSTIKKNNCKTKAVGGKVPNELGLYDMSGNVREWCEDWFEDAEITRGFVRVQRGGGWLGAEHCCTSFYRDNFEANGKGPDQGFRICRSK